VGGAFVPSALASDATPNVGPRISRYELAPPNRVPTTPQTAGDSLACSRSMRSESQRAGMETLPGSFGGTGADRPVKTAAYRARLASRTAWAPSRGDAVIVHRSTRKGGRPRRPPMVGRGVGGAIVPSAWASDATSSTVSGHLDYGCQTRGAGTTANRRQSPSPRRLHSVGPQWACFLRSAPVLVVEDTAE
jgi:hypothetical protein